jgi:hypothetical protein
MKKFHISIFFFIITAAAYASPGILRERMYIATDKECYLSGENVWLSAFCFDLNTGAASNGSAVAYIELQNLSRSLVQAKIKLSLGRGSGHLALPLTLPTGIYRLTAYTRYMLSEDKEIFYARYITVYNPQTSLRSDNVIVAGEGTTDMTAPVRTLLSGKNSRLITLSTDRESYAPGPILKCSLKIIREKQFQPPYRFLPLTRSIIIVILLSRNISFHSVRRTERSNGRICGLRRRSDLRSYS